MFSTPSFRWGEWLFPTRLGGMLLFFFPRGGRKPGPQEVVPHLLQCSHVLPLYATAKREV